jgi:hypothetical protein
MVREKRARRPVVVSVWDRPHIRRMLDEPLGSAVKLTQDEAVAIALDSFGKGTGWPSGVEYVKRVRPIWKGLLKKADG